MQGMNCIDVKVGLFRYLVYTGVVIVIRHQFVPNLTILVKIPKELAFCLLLEYN